MGKSIAIITARGGSKRIPKKNIREFCGKPIISYAIQAALESKVFDEIMVSTDSQEIAEIAKKYGANVPFIRSAETANDYATTSEVLLEVIEEYEKRNQVFEYACCIYPTAPFITGEKLKIAIEKVKKGGIDTVIPVVVFSYPPQRGMILDKERIVLKWLEYINSRTQDLEIIYHDCGQFYSFRVDSFKINKNLMIGNIAPMIFSELEVQDIDTEEDWRLAELKYKLYREKMGNVL